METKKCTKCGVEKEAAFENFQKNKAFSSGMTARCKECLREEQRIYRQKPENKERHRSSGMTARCKECLREEQRIYRQKPENKERHRLSQAKWRKENPEKSKEISRKTYLKHKDRLNKKRKERYHNDKEYRAKKDEADKCYRKSKKGKAMLNKPENREKARLRAKKYREKNKEKIAKYAKQYKLENKDFIRYLDRKKNKELPDSEIKSRIKRYTGIPYEDITPEMIETKRLLIFIKRELKNLENGKQES
jgi:hypothetical protein